MILKVLCLQVRLIKYVDTVETKIQNLVVKIVKLLYIAAKSVNQKTGNKLVTNQYAIHSEVKCE